jgi:co-chaperonin GroES (HSP10)
MTFMPMNRHLLVEPVEQEEKEEVGFVLPDDFQASFEPYKLVTILDKSEDLQDQNRYRKGDVALVESSMLKNAKAGSVNVYLVQENYILGIIKGGKIL